jgi:hypothetical protein
VKFKYIQLLLLLIFCLIGQIQAQVMPPPGQQQQQQQQQVREVRDAGA